MPHTLYMQIDGSNYEQTCSLAVNVYVLQITII